MNPLSVNAESVGGAGSQALCHYDVIVNNCALTEVSTCSNTLDFLLLIDDRLSKIDAVPRGALTFFYWPISTYTRNSQYNSHFWLLACSVESDGQCCVDVLTLVKKFAELQ
jgi:hypothetical protein